MTPKIRSLIQLNLAVFLWGGTAMFAKGISLPIGHIICLRSFIAAGLLLIFLLTMRIPIKVNGVKHYAVMSILGFCLCMHWLTFFQSLRISSAAVAILSLHTYPVLTAILEPVLFREKLRRADLGLVFVVFLGVLIMTPEISLSNTTTQGILLGVVSGLFFMTRNLMTRKFVQSYTSSTLMFWQTLTTGVILTPLLFLSETPSYSIETLGLLLLLGTLFTAIPQTLFSASFKNLSAKTVGVLATLLPFYGAFFGYLIHDETLAPRTAIGGLLILICILIETLKQVRAAVPETTDESAS
jgi:drug/metabolite transporter (DMT)-like permease